MVWGFKGGEFDSLRGPIMSCFGPCQSSPQVNWEWGARESPFGPCLPTTRILGLIQDVIWRKRWLCPWGHLTPEPRPQGPHPKGPQLCSRLPSLPPSPFPSFVRFFSPQSALQGSAFMALLPGPRSLSRPLSPL